VIAEISTPAANDQLIARLYDENVAGGTEQLIGRQAYRPLNPGEGFTKQVFQLHPQAWKVEAGHALKLELMVADNTSCTGLLPACYVRPSSSPHSIQVRNLELRVPTADAPGSAEGLVKTPNAPYLPSGYTLARNERTTAPGQPHLTSGVSPNGTGVFTLGWAPSEAATALTYTLEHQNALGGWSVVASGLTSPEYAFTGGGPEGEGTWTYRVVASNEGPASLSEESGQVVVDESAPNAPTASADRAPDYAGGGGWYKDSVTVAFTDNGDPLLSDGSAGSGVNPASISSPQTFNSDGSHTASGTVGDNAGNVSSAGTLTVQVDVSPPSVEASCPAPVSIGAKGVNATVTASDGQSGLAKDPSGSYPINTTTSGVKTVKVTAIDNVGHETEASCSTLVGYTQVITGNVRSKLVVKAGQAIKLASTAKVSGPVTVQPGGALDVEGATISGSLTAKEATLLRICAATVSSALKAVNGSGSVVIGEGDPSCGSSNLHGVSTLKGNKAGVLVDENAFFSALKVIGNAGGTTVINNTIAGEFIVKGNTGTVVDTPNEAEGKVNIQ
jgi:hypothetical protein